MLAEAEIWTALRDCFDPEVKLNLVDLGLIYSVETGADPDSTEDWPRQWVKVTMTLTSDQGPASGLIFEQVNNRLKGIPAIGQVTVNLVWEPRWTPERISPAGHQQMGDRIQSILPSKSVAHPCRKERGKDGATSLVSISGLE
jgi:metal-sulfur cluster biosynthetic enzyme